MSRFLLALGLSIFAAAALASTPAASDDPAGAGVKPGKAATVGGAQDGDAAVGGHPIAAPAHGSTPHAVSPRWHSLLPGMIR